MLGVCLLSSLIGCYYYYYYYYLWKDDCYLDWAGAALPIQQQQQKQQQGRMGNPHSFGDDAYKRMQMECEECMLQLVNASSNDYHVIWTSGTTDACKVLSCDLLPPIQTMLHSHNVHTSILAMRQVLSQKYQTIISCTTIQQLEQSPLPTTTTTTPSLVLCPLECNLTGRITSTTYLKHRPSNWWWFCDVAKAVSSGTVNVKELGYPEFLALSLYKIFGQPTGLGCLFVHKSVPIVQPTYMGGGTMQLALPHSHYTQSIPLPNLYQSGGTPHYQGIQTLHHQLIQSQQPLRHQIQLGGQNAIMCFHYFTSQVSKRLKFTHNDKPLLHLYHQQPRQGPTMACQVYQPNGKDYVPISHVHQLARRHNIHFRIGCCCNPGACHELLGIQEEEMQQLNAKSQYSCGQQNNNVDFIHFNPQRPTGVIRISFGSGSTIHDVNRLITFFQQNYLLPPPTTVRKKVQECTLMEQYIYPIKSCRGIRVSSWPIVSTNGTLQYDRTWAIVSSSTNQVIRLQEYPTLLSQLQPHINLETNELQIFVVGNPKPVVTLPLTPPTTSPQQEISICGNARTCMAHKNSTSSEASKWISNYLSISCYFTQTKDTTHHNNTSFANEAPLLVITRESIQTLSQKMPIPISSLQFRPNWVVSCSNGEQVDEQTWMELVCSHQQHTFNVVGPCGRCAMIDIHPNTGSKMKTSALRALSNYRKQNGQVTFGTFLSLADNKTTNNKPIIMNESTIFQIKYKE